MIVDNRALLEYACEKFQEEKYDEALEIFVLLYMRAYEQDWILETIYSCYMSGNLQEFQNAFEQNADAENLAYEDCVLDFIPYQDGKYYIYDKELAVFRGIFSCNDLAEADLDAMFDNMEFSAAALELDWNWNEELSVLASAKDRKIYVVAHDLKRCISFFKLPELTEYLVNIKIFSDISEFRGYFHENTEVYLPKCWKGSELVNQFADIINQEHLYRLTPEGRDTKNVLLTIGIPTHDRGNLLLERIKNLCEMPYDSEVEFAISKHGTHYYQDEYKSVEDIGDARMNYVGCDEELGISGNWQKVVKIAHGKFVLLVSDEDDVICSALEHYFKLLSEHENLGYVRAGTTLQYRLKQDKYFKQGKEAFEGGFLGQNYLSGTIYNKCMFEEADLAQYDLKYKDNDFFYFYPHMWWQVVMSFKGDYAEDSRCLIREGDSVWKEERNKLVRDGLAEVNDAVEKKPEIIEKISSYEARLKQFRGIVAMIKDSKEFDDELRRQAIFLSIGKTYYLMEMVNNICKDSEEEFAGWIEKLVEEALSAMQTMKIEPERQKYILANMIMWINENMEQYKEEK